MSTFTPYKCTFFAKCTTLKISYIQCLSCSSKALICHWESLSSSRVKRSSHIVCDSDDYLDRDIYEIADAMATESEPSTSGAAQPTLSDMMDLLQHILPCLYQILHYLNPIEQDIKEIKEC